MATSADIRYCAGWEATASHWVSLKPRFFQAPMQGLGFRVLGLGVWSLRFRGLEFWV